MSQNTKNARSAVLIVGGSGVVGSRAAKELRRLHPDLPIAIGGRNLDKAAALAKEIGGATAVKLDLERPDLGLSAEATFSAVLVLLKDESLHTLKYAQAKGLPYISFSNWIFDIAPEVAHYIHKPTRAPILMLGHIFGGTGTLSTLYFAKEFRTIDAIELGVVLDSDDVGGPAAHGDIDRIAKGVTYPPILKDGKWVWAEGEDAARSFKASDGTEHRGQGLPVLDTVSLAAATSAKTVRVDLAVRDAASRPSGQGISHEILIDITGERNDGTKGRFRYEFVDARAHSETSALGAALAVERLLGLAGGPPVAPGLYHPEKLIDPAYAIQRLKEFGTRVGPA